ncbi:ABC-type transporter membrane protein [Psychroflexus torquis ATCC 700755]|uniref:ABC-type transporter membrane protein n=1 Tax=Psychroflexus torquis (strain ATCC 700755 / CIP 106069 / ACAM 623) TaxID=313595 RepID=K4ID20_PSYTT|nr:ABC-2 transporter permease [Psychroflexus torquis]AFU68319.1 ABC-type transporter membrane protein [Psychroflexus torquis ATCC 700755]
MLQLILKDFRANWLYQLVSLAILFCISLLFIYHMIEENGSADPELVIYFVVVLLSSSAVSLVFMMIDEMYKMNEFCISLPVTRNQIVVAKYTSSIVQLALALVLHFLGVQVVVYFHGGLGNPELEIINNPIIWISAFMILLLFKSYSYPIYFKFGLMKGVAIHSVLQFILFVIFVVLMANYNHSWNGYPEGISWILNQNKWALLIVVTAFTILMMKGSTVLSTKIFKKKDI